MTRGSCGGGISCRLELVVADPRAGQSGDQAFSAMLASARKELYACALFLTQDRVAADDLVQATLERGLSARHRFQSGSNLMAWLKKILRNLLTDERRHAVVSRRPIEWPCSEPEESPGPRDLLGTDDVVQALRQLRAADRELIELAYIKRVPHRDISARIGVRMNTTGTRLFRAKAKLRRILQRVYAERMASLHDAPVVPTKSPLARTVRLPLSAQSGSFDLDARVALVIRRGRAPGRASADVEPPASLHVVFEV